MPARLPDWWWKWWRGSNPILTSPWPLPAPAPAPSPSPSPTPRGPHSTGVFRWLHQDGDLDGISAASLETAKRGAWMSLDRKSRTRQFRAFVVLSLRIATLSWRPRPLGQLEPHLYSNADRNAAGSVIARTLVLLAPSRIRPGSDILTDEAEPAQGTIETGIVHVVTIVLITVCAIAAAYLGTVIAQAIHAVNFDDEVTKRLLAAQARAMEILTLHIERERIAGRELPFDETEKSMLLALEDIQRQLATLKRRPLPSPFEGATEFVRSTTTGLLPIAAIVVVAFFLLQQQQQQRRS